MQCDSRLRLSFRCWHGRLQTSACIQMQSLRRLMPETLPDLLAMHMSMEHRANGSKLRSDT